jgi:hypothetical protein
VGRGLSALNFQTSSGPIWLSDGLFVVDGVAGFVLSRQMLIAGAQAAGPGLQLEIAVLCSGGPYVEVGVLGWPGDTARSRTAALLDNGFDPAWNKSFSFCFAAPEIDFIAVCLRDEGVASDGISGTRQPNGLQKLQFHRSGKYEGCGDLIRKRVEKKMDHFTETLDHFMRILRFIKTGRGKALLIGLGRRGKKWPTRVAAFSAVYDVFEITLPPKYNKNIFAWLVKHFPRGWAFSGREALPRGGVRANPRGAPQEHRPNTILEEESGPRIGTQLPHRRRCPR